MIYYLLSRLIACDDRFYYFFFITILYFFVLFFYGIFYMLAFMTLELLNIFVKTKFPENI